MMTRFASGPVGLSEFRLAGLWRFALYQNIPHGWNRFGAFLEELMVEGMLNTFYNTIDKTISRIFSLQ